MPVIAPTIVQTTHGTMDSSGLCPRIPVAQHAAGKVTS
jgi:hypothetical protein